ncbi:glutamate-5-semialdehyde dehydrogenase [Pigmentibacter ruber]|uniref:glutamate-5-semialdehyde dehydrogenase n=1 Tax=Pigmentibacter ruber TaxID=2683196 RepID=UPI00131AA957|nr:glutamate-5-semialdehyde dehydrogenase [Pigmentibacter ruber]
MSNLIKIFTEMKNLSKNFSLDEKKINDILLDISNKLIKNKELIIDENKKDLANVNPQNPMYDRLLLNENRINTIANDLLNIIKIPSPLKKILEERNLKNGLKLQKISVPLGVVSVIFESRPNVTLDVFSLCLKSGNICILKGGKEAYYSNKVLIDIIKKSLEENKVNSKIIFLLPNERNAAEELFNATGLIDVCIPRGGKGLIDYVRQNSKIPVIETGAGIVHTYFDESGDLLKGISIIENAKTRRVSVCNALDTLVIHKNRLSDLFKLIEPLISKNVTIYADEISHAFLVNKYPASLLNIAHNEHYGIEFLDYKMSIKTVDSLENAIAHIHKYTSSHSEAIIAEDKEVLEEFLHKVDAAVVYANAPTSFTDGGQFEMGAEIGISTQKLHARGPMALNELTSYKWLVRGNGQTRQT